MDEDAIALRLGRLVIASARLELEVSYVAEFLGEANVGALSQLNQIKAIRRHTAELPGGEEIAAWANAAHDVLNERGELVHGGFLGRWKGNTMIPAYIARKRNEVVDVNFEKLDALVEDAKKLAVDGHGHSLRLFQKHVDPAREQNYRS